jgi:hypothetical protein
MKIAFTNLYQVCKGLAHNVMEEKHFNTVDEYERVFEKVLLVAIECVNQGKLTAAASVTMKIGLEQCEASQAKIAGILTGYQEKERGKNIVKQRLHDARKQIRRCVERKIQEGAVKI